MRFRILHIVILLLTALLTACTDDLSFTEPVESKGGKVAVEFSLNIAEAREVLTRAFGDDMSTPAQWANMPVYLVVFDKNGFWLETAEAENKAVGTDEVTFTALLTPSGEKRIVHFVANYENKADLEKAGIHESSLMASPTVEQDVYWQRVELDWIKDTGTRDEGCEYNNGSIYPETAFTKVPLIRNFAQIEITNAAASLDADKGKFTITGYRLYHCPVAGTFAPFNTRNGGNFVTYYKTDASGNTVSKSYSDFLDENYQGVGVSPDEDSNYESRDLINIPDQNNIPASYLYETPNATGDYKGKTFIVVKGYMGNNSSEVKYHKIDLIYYADKSGKPITDGTTGAIDVRYYNLLRNLRYKVKIESVTGGGYDSVDEAAKHASSNNVYASIQTEDVTSIGDAQQRLYVESTYVLCTTLKKDTEVTVGYKYLSPDNGKWKNSSVNVSHENGDFADLTLSDNDESNTAEHWSYATLKLKEDLTESQTVTVHFRVINDVEIISRDVTVVFCKPYKLRVECLNSQDRTKVVDTAVNQGVEVDLYIPKGLPQQIFPLSFSMEPEGKTIYPNVVDDTALNLKANSLPVSLSESINPDNGSVRSFVYTKVLTYDDYSNKPAGYVEDAGEEGIRVRCYFKTNCEENATTVYACNEYFSPDPNDLSQYPTGTSANDSFENPTIKSIALSGAQYYGAGQTVTLNIGTRNEKDLTITISEEGAGETVITWVPGQSSYTYTTQTFGGKITATVSVDGTTESTSVEQVRTTLKQPKFTATGDGLSKDYSYSQGRRTYSYSKSNQSVTVKKNGSTIGSGTISTAGFVGDVVVGEGLGESDTVTLEYSFTPTYTDRWGNTSNGTTQTRRVSTTISALMSGTATLDFKN